LSYCDLADRAEARSSLLFRPGGIPDHELTDSLYGNGKAALRMTARTGVQSSLPFSRSSRSGHSSKLDVGALPLNRRSNRRFQGRGPNLAKRS